MHKWRKKKTINMFNFQCQMLSRAIAQDKYDKFMCFQCSDQFDLFLDNFVQRTSRVLGRRQGLFSRELISTIKLLPSLNWKKRALVSCFLNSTEKFENIGRLF